MYEGVFKKTEDFENAKNNNENIDNFNKFPMYRALRYKSENHDAIAKLCKGASLSELKDGTWVVELPKMVDNKIVYSYFDHKEFNDTFKKYDASGVLGCGTGSERFNNF